MASAAQQRREEFARRLGYRSYLDYRNAQARTQGYRSYAEQRKARRSGVGLRGADRVPLRTPTTRSRGFLRPEPPGIFEQGVAFDAGPLERHLARLRAADTDLNHVPIFFRDRIIKGQQRGGVLKTARREALQRAQAAVRHGVDAADAFYLESFKGIVFDAYQRGLGVPGAEPSPELLNRIGQQVVRGRNDVRSAALAADRSTKRLLEELPRAENDRQLNKIVRRGIRSVSFRDGTQRRFGEYLEMSMRANAVRAFNTSYLEGLRERGVDVVVISDGSDCGLTSHQDPQRANGMVVDLETALAYPLAHPYCVRSFGPAAAGATPEGDKATLARRAARLIGTAATESLKETAKATLQEVNRRHDLSRKAVQMVTHLARHFHARFQTVRASRYNNVINIATGRPVTTQDLLQNTRAAADDFARGEDVSMATRQLLGVDAMAPRKVVGDAYGNFDEYYHRVARGYLSVEGESPITETTRDSFFNEFVNAVTGTTRGHVRFTTPYIHGGEGTFYQTLRANLDLDKVRLFVQPGHEGGWLANLRLNPDGLVRAGFLRNAAGVIQPRLSVIPDGPIRLITRVNRGADGRITSLSGEIRLITPKRAIRTMNHLLGLDRPELIQSELGKLGLNFSARFNLNLRQLGLERLSDVRRLTLDDWRALRLAEYENPITGLIEQHPTIRMVSLAAEWRLRGGSLFDLARTWRLPWEDVEWLWSLSSLELRRLALEKAIAVELGGVSYLERVERLLRARRRARLYTTPVHPYTLAQSRARRGGIALHNRTLTYLEDVPED